MTSKGPQGKYWSSVDAREPQNPTFLSEEYQRHLQGDSQEQASCATYGFLGLIQVPYEAPVYNVGLPQVHRGVGTGNGRSPAAAAAAVVAAAAAAAAAQAPAASSLPVLPKLH
eukprot:9496250-Pyramimonas_sp.AAC.6